MERVNLGIRDNEVCLTDVAPGESVVIYNDNDHEIYLSNECGFAHRSDGIILKSEFKCTVKNNSDNTINVYASSPEASADVKIVDNTYVIFDVQPNSKLV